MKTLLPSSRTFGFATLFLSSLLGSSAMAALVETPLPTNAYITMNGFDWAWGNSCTSKGAGDCDTPSYDYQFALGWRIATSADMPLAPLAIDFLFPGGNVPYLGVDPVSGGSFEYLNDVYLNARSDGACASSYFTLGDGNNTCDWQNGSGQDVNTVGWFNQNGQSAFYSDVLFIRDSVPVPEVPVPAAAWLFGSALAGFAGLKRRRKLAA